MKTALLILLVVHGLIHGMGFAKAFGLAEVSELTQNISRPHGVAWLLAGLLFLVTAFLFFMKNEWWWAVGIAAVVVSQVLIFAYWRDAKFGTVANLLVLLPVLVGLFTWKFNRQIESEAISILSKPNDRKAFPIDEDDFYELPYPVQFWLDESEVIGKVPTKTARLRQKGRLRTAPDKEWTPFTAEQYFNLEVPGFVWKAKNQMMPGIDLTIRDKYADGKGNMLVKLWSAIPMVDEANDKIDEASLQRFLAEICWTPSAALLPYIHWEPIDSRSARAILTYGNSQGGVVFHFDDNSAVSRIETQRFKDTGPDSERHTWLIEILETRRLNGVPIPTKLSLTWRLPEGDFTWMEIEVTEVNYDVSKLFEK